MICTWKAGWLSSNSVAPLGNLWSDSPSEQYELMRTCPLSSTEVDREPLGEDELSTLVSSALIGSGIC